jgi:hypothetical protein
VIEGIRLKREKVVTLERLVVRGVLPGQSVAARPSRWTPVVITRTGRDDPSVASKSWLAWLPGSVPWSCRTSVGMPLTVWRPVGVNLTSSSLAPARQRPSTGGGAS